MPNKIRSPRDLDRMNHEQLTALCGDIRDRIIRACANGGGHLASNLGVVELTVALHRVFNAPRDKIIFDVGHQCYAHKLLTGRADSFDTLRQKGGISGFPSRAESEYDPLYEGHCGTSISAALGIAEANARMGSDAYTIAVAGDGAFTNGMIYEAMNNCGGKKLRLVIILNDNGMSISDSVGGLPRYFGKIRSSKGYLKLKNETRDLLDDIPLIGHSLARAARVFKNFWKKILLKPVLFDDFGLTYLGPVDGSDLNALETILKEAKRRDEICLVHVKTTKGRGYARAEENPTVYHSTGKFNRREGFEPSEDSGFSTVFGDKLCELAEKDERICAITAAMTDGTGLSRFSQEHSDRFFDVGIAEEHAVTFAGGLAAGGMKPVCALYSTFLQRCYDQLVHDISLQGLDMVLAIDRAGLVPADGVTHQGTLDVAMLTSIPGVSIWSPETYAELQSAMDAAMDAAGIAAVRYGKGSERQYDRSGFAHKDSFDVYGPEGVCDAVIVTYGRVTMRAWEAAQRLGGQKVRIIKLVKIFPLDMAALLPYLEGARLVYMLEEGIKQGGIGEKLAAQMAEAGLLDGTKLHIHAVEGYLPHATVAELEELCGFTADTVAENITALLG